MTQLSAEVQAAAQKAQMVHNASVQDVDTDAIAADELWSFVEKNIHRCLPEELVAGDCAIALSLASLSGLILTGRVGKHTDKLAQELISTTEGKTDCKEWSTDGWEGYGRVLPDEVDHYISKALTQRLERTNGILRQQTGRWHRRQNKFSKVWEQTEVTLRLVLSYFNWYGLHSCLGTTAASASRVNRSCLDLE
jgi:IS1 family transposase